MPEQEIIRKLENINREINNLKKDHQEILDMLAEIGNHIAEKLGKTTPP